MFKRIIIQTLFFVLVLTVSTYGQTVTEKLKVKDFQHRSAENSEAVILDVRTAAEVNDGFIPGAIFVDYKKSDFKEEISSLDKSKPYFVYCASGVRSAKAIDVMRDMGFENLYQLDGGFVAWKKTGMKIEKKK